MPYLRPTEKHPEFRDDGPKRPSIQFFGEKILENIEKCPVAQFIIIEWKTTDFVRRGNKTKLGIHVETCEICQGASQPAPISQGETEIPMYEISKSVARKLTTRYRDLDSRDTSRLVDALIDDTAMYERLIKEKDQKIKVLEQKYEDLKLIRESSLKPILFPQQKRPSLDEMQSKNLKYKDELLKKYEIEIARLKSIIAELGVGL